MSANYIQSVPSINLTDDELAAVAATVRRAIEDDRFPHAPRLDPLRAALGKFEAAEPTSQPKAGRRLNQTNGHGDNARKDEKAGGGRNVS
jgi:uncharacterized protein YciW